MVENSTIILSVDFEVSYISGHTQRHFKKSLKICLLCKEGRGSIHELFGLGKKQLPYLYCRSTNFVWSQGNLPSQWLRSSSLPSPKSTGLPHTYTIK